MCSTGKGPRPPSCTQLNFWVAAYCPLHRLLTDGGPQFPSCSWSQICILHCTDPRVTTPSYIAVFPILADVVEVKTGSWSTAHWRIHFIRLNGWLRHSFAQLITLLDIDGIGQNWEDSDMRTNRQTERFNRTMHTILVDLPGRRNARCEKDYAHRTRRCPTDYRPPQSHPHATVLWLSILPKVSSNRIFPQSLCFPPGVIPNVKRFALHHPPSVVPVVVTLTLSTSSRGAPPPPSSTQSCLYHLSPPLPVVGGRRRPPLLSRGIRRRRHRRLLRLGRGHHGTKSGGRSFQLFCPLGGAGGGNHGAQRRRRRRIGATVAAAAARGGGRRRRERRARRKGNGENGARAEHSGRGAHERCRGGGAGGHRCVRRGGNSVGGVVEASIVRAAQCSHFYS